jgi:hypothetical protein
MRACVMRECVRTHPSAFERTWPGSGSRRGDKKPGPSLKNEPRKAETSRFQKEVFTPLNTSLTEVFSAIKGDPAFRWPPKMKADPFKRDRSKFCEYHADHGHLTED